MIKTLRINNFKSIKEIKLKCSKINILVGRPNVGKSNILESLGIVSSIGHNERFHNVDLISKEFVRYNKLLNLFYDNNPKNKIQFELDDVVCTISSRNKFLTCRMFIKNQKPEENYFEFGVSDSKDTSTRHGVLAPIINKISPIQFYRFKAQAKYTSDDFNYLLPPFGDNLVTILQSNPELRELIVDLLEPYGYKLLLGPDTGEIEIYREEKGIAIRHALNLTADTIQFMIYYLAALKSNRRSILVFEEPETHLFPYYSKFLAESIASNINRNQFFISTHNPFFLTSVIEKSKKEDISIHIVDYKDYQTKLHTLTNDQIEEVYDWDNIFFNLENT